jgi:hypothetical protein
MNKTKAVVFLLASLIMFCSALNGQIANYYAFTQNANEWEPIWGTFATEAMTDEGITPPIGLGFDFPYGTNTYSQVRISSNGWVGLGTNLTLPYYANDLATLNIRPLLAPLWDDISLQFGAVHYASYGVAPHRVFFVQWLAAKWNYNAMNEYNFMVRIHETGQADFIYGTNIGSPSNASASIGINMTPGGSGNYFSIVPGNPAVAHTTTQYQNIQTFPGLGTMYIFMPRTTEAQNAAAVNLRGNRNPMQNIVNEYVVTVGNAGTGQIAANSVTAYLMRGEEVLAETQLPYIASGNFGSATLQWTPDETGLMYLYAKVDLAEDADSLNNDTFPFAVTVQPYVSNDDNLAPSVDLSLKAYPNPFSASVSIDYAIKNGSQVTVEVFDIKGRKVDTLVREYKNPGNYTIGWNGPENRSSKTADGIYLLKITTENEALTRKLILLK